MPFGKGVSDLPCDAPSYTVWYSMMRRCYSEVYQRSKPTYKGTVVSEDWQTHSNFSNWYSENFVDGWQLDKDLLGNGKLYSKDTCCFLPNQINTILRFVRKPNVSYINSKGKWCAQISSLVLGKRKGVHLLYTECKEEAEMHYNEVQDLVLKLLAEKYKSQLKPEVFKKLMTITD